MATIDDIGDTTEPLGQPLFGGPNGWAAAVRDHIKDLPGLIAGKVAKAGDTMGGDLIFSEWIGVKFPVGKIAEVGGALTVMDGTDGTHRPLTVANPTDQAHATTKGYVDHSDLYQYTPKTGQVVGTGFSFNSINEPGLYGSLVGPEATDSPPIQGYWYVVVYAFSGNLTQIAYQYATGAGEGPLAYTRGYYGGLWTSWRAL